MPPEMTDCAVSVSVHRVEEVEEEGGLRMRNKRHLLRSTRRYLFINPKVLHDNKETNAQTERASEWFERKMNKI